MTSTGTLSAIIQATAEHYQFPVDALTAPHGSRTVSNARHVAMFLAYRIARISLADIAAAFNVNSRSGVWTVIQAVDKKRTQVEAIETIRERLGLGTPVYFLHEATPDAPEPEAPKRRSVVAPVDDEPAVQEPAQVAAPRVRLGHRFVVPSCFVWHRSRVTVPGSAVLERGAVS